MMKPLRDGIREVGRVGPLVARADWMKGREEHLTVELDLTPLRDKDDARKEYIGLIFDFDTGQFGLVMEMPKTEAPPAEMLQPVKDWREVNPPVGDPHSEWAKKWDEAQKKSKTEPAAP